MVDGDHAGHSWLGAPSGFGPNIALDETDEIVQGLSLFGSEGPLLPLVGLLPEEALGFSIVVQVEPVDKIDPENQVDSQIFDQHEVRSQCPVPNLDGHQVSTICLKHATVGCFEDSRLGVEQLGFQVPWNPVECLLLDATDVSSCVVQPHKSST